jgi:hypothetical protein
MFWRMQLSNYVKDSLLEKFRLSEYPEITALSLNPFVRYHVHKSPSLDPTPNQMNLFHTHFPFM